MTIAEQLTDRILDTVTDAGTNPHTTLEALKMVVGIVAVDGLEENDPAVDASIGAGIRDVTRAITDLQKEIMRVRSYLGT